MKKSQLIEIIKEEIKKVLREDSFPRASNYGEKREPINKQRIDNFVEAIRNALKKHEPVINTGVDGFEKLNDTEFEQVRAEADKNGWELIQFEENYQTTSYSMKKKGSVNEFITSGNALDVLDNAARDINKDFFNNRGEYNPTLYQMSVRDGSDNVLKILDKKTDVKERGKGFTAKADEAQEYYELPEYNVAISFDQYKMTRGTTIQFLSFDGELPEKKGMYN